MVREFYRVLNFVLFVVLALLLSALQSVLLRVSVLSWMELDILLLFVVYFAINRPLWEAALLVLIVSRVAELHSGSPAGMLSFCYMFVCLTLYCTKELFLFGTSFALVLIGILAGLLFKLSYLALAYHLGSLDNVWFFSLQLLLPYLLGMALLARPVFSFGVWIDTRTHYRELSEAKRMAGEDF